MLQEFDCNLGGANHQTCIMKTEKVDGKWLIYRNCGGTDYTGKEEGCTTDVHNTTICRCNTDLCNDHGFSGAHRLKIASLVTAVLTVAAVLM